MYRFKISCRGRIRGFEVPPGEREALVGLPSIIASSERLMIRVGLGGGRLPLTGLRLDAPWCQSPEMPISINKYKNSCPF